VIGQAYGYALYYPYIELLDDTWIKAAALFYDGLKRIVPSYYEPDDSNVVKALIDELGFLTNLDPAEEAIGIGHDFLACAREEFIGSKSENHPLRAIRTEPLDAVFAIHGLKLAPKLRRELPRLGLAKRSRGGPITEDWFLFDAWYGVLYMSMLANRMAEKRGLAIVTDNSNLQPLVWRMQSDRVLPIDHAQAISSLVVRAYVPDDLAVVPVKTIIQFRRRHDDERRRFYDAVSGLARDIPTITHEDALQDCLHHHSRNIDQAVEDLKFSLEGLKLKTVLATLALSIPSWAPNLAATGSGAAPLVVAAAGAASVAAGTILATGLKYYQSRVGSPWSYVLSLEAGLERESFIRSLFRGSVVL
jgi:hypothetical protein